MFKIISSLEKCFLDETFASKPVLKKASVLKNEVYRFGGCYTCERYLPWITKQYVKLTIDSPLEKYIKVFKVDHVPVKLPYATSQFDADFLRTKPGLYPDLLTPLRDDGRLAITGNLDSLYFEFSPNGEVAPGKYDVTIKLNDVESDADLGQGTITITVIDAELPKQEIMVTQWFYCDCLQTYYNTQNFDEQHWQIIENFVKMAVDHGINMLLTPVFTPALDTYVGGERPTTQLVDVNLNNGEYSFGFEKLNRWVDMCNKLGVKYFEIAHFFTQWGAAHAPKVMATVDGEYKKIFGWETDATGDEYVKFLNAFIPALLEFMKSKDGADKRCWFHISDEPTLDHLEQYKASRAVVEKLLKDYPIMDALSNYEFYEQGIVKTPVPGIDHIEPFIENKVKDLWCYYCCCQWKKVSNRFMAMPSYRTRIIGTQFYKYDIVGFLQWGYNFYYNQFSYGYLNPYVSTDGEYFAGSGDPFSVYPGIGGVPLPSLRLKLFHDALQDVAALKLCESLYNKDFVIGLMEEGEEPITFSEYPRDINYLPNLREKVNAAIAAKVGK